MDPIQRHYRALIAALSRDRLPDDPELVAARQNFAAATLARAIRDKAPELSSAQRYQLVELLTAGAA